MAQRSLRTIKDPTWSPLSTSDGGDELDLVAVLEDGAGVACLGDKFQVDRCGKRPLEPKGLNGQSQCAGFRDGVGGCVDQDVNGHGSKVVNVEVKDEQKTLSICVDSLQGASESWGVSQRGGLIESPSGQRTVRVEDFVHQPTPAHSRAWQVRSKNHGDTGH